MCHQLFAFGFFLLLTPFVAHPRESAQKIIRELQSKAAGLRTLQGNLAITAAFPKSNHKKETFEAVGRLSTEAPDHFKLDLKANVNDPDRGSPMKFATQAILDGKTLWLSVINAEGKTSFLSSFDFEKLKDEFPDVFVMRDVEAYINPAEELNELDPNHVKLLGRTVLFGKPVVILEGTLKHALPITFLGIAPDKDGAPAKVRLWVGTGDGVGYQIIMLDAEGKQTGVMRLSRVRLNANLDPSTFQFTPPEGATPVDMTSTLEDELRTKGQKRKP